MFNIFRCYDVVSGCARCGVGTIAAVVIRCTGDDTGCIASVTAMRVLLCLLCWLLSFMMVMML